MARAGGAFRLHALTHDLAGMGQGQSWTFGYDPAGRLYQTVGGGVTTRFLYAGGQIVGEYNGSNALQRRFVPGLALDDAAMWYEGAGTSDRRTLLADERGSVIAMSGAAAGGLLAGSINTYDEYGQGATSNTGRFQFNGQPWLAEAGLYHYRARAYSQTLGRFMQTDPMLWSRSMNLYAYVGNDPVNFTDPLGLEDITVLRSPQPGSASRPGRRTNAGLRFPSTHLHRSGRANQELRVWR